MKKIILYLIGVCGILVLYSYSLKSLKNEEIFYKKYEEIGNTLDDNSTEEFFKLREKHLSNRYFIHDLGFTGVAIFISILILISKKFNKLPKKKSHLFLFFFFGFILFSMSLYFHLFLDFSRNSNPWWADSIGIPLYYLKQIVAYISYYFIICSTGLLFKFEDKNSFKQFVRSNKLVSVFFLIQFTLTVLTLLITLYYLFFLSAFSLLLICLFYISLLRLNQNEIQ